MENTFVMVKPDGVQRGLAGDILKRFQAKGFKVRGLKLIQVTSELAEQHYAEHKGKPFYPGLVEYITSGPVLLMALEGKTVVSEVRKMVGATNPKDAQPGTIRGDFAQDIGRNIIHASDSVESAKQELGIYFKPEEILEYEYLPYKWLFE